MGFHVYILLCADGSYYTGHTDGLETRLGEHAVGAIRSCYTFQRRPVRLVFSQPFAIREEALAGERQIKGWSRKKKEAMMRIDWADVSRLARSAASVVPRSSVHLLLRGSGQASTSSGRTEARESPAPGRTEQEEP